MSEAIQRQTGQMPAWLLFRGWRLASLEPALTSTARVSANSSWLCATGRRIRMQQWPLRLANGACRCLLLAQSWC
jgi:hypothetical protein